MLEARAAFAKGRKSRDVHRAMSSPAITPEQLASALAARLLHDAMGPASGIVSAFDLVADPSAAAMREEALALAEESARKLVDLLVLSRTIYAGGNAMTAVELRGSAQGLFNGTRATLDLVVVPEAVSVMSGRLLLGLLQTAATTVAAGGAVVASLKLNVGRLVVEGAATGPRLRVGEEMLDGLAGKGPGDAPLHRWSAAYMLGALAKSAGGGIEAAVVEGRFVFRADIRADIA